MLSRVVQFISGLFLLALLAVPASATTQVTDVRLWSGPEGTRVVLRVPIGS